MCGVYVVHPLDYSHWLFTLMCAKLTLWLALPYPLRFPPFLKYQWCWQCLFASLVWAVPILGQLAKKEKLYLWHKLNPLCMQHSHSLIFALYSLSPSNRA